MTQGYTPAGYVMNMAYDAENRLVSAEYTDSSSVVHRTEYSYSGDNLLAEMKKYENGTMVSDIRFIRAGFLPVQERDGSNVVMREYNWGLNYGGGIGGLLSLNQGGLDYSYLYDGKENVSALIDSSQNVVATYTYDPFGVLMEKTGTIDQPYQFSTKRYDESTGLSYYGYRYYSPSIGRWITRDPIGEAGGINLYGFVGNNPVNWVDPWGETLLITVGVPTVVIVGTVGYLIYKWWNKPQTQNAYNQMQKRREAESYEDYIRACEEDNFEENLRDSVITLGVGLEVIHDSQSHFPSPNPFVPPFPNTRKIKK